MPILIGDQAICNFFVRFAESLQSIVPMQLHIGNEFSYPFFRSRRRRASKYEPTLHQVVHDPQSSNAFLQPSFYDGVNTGA